MKILRPVLFACGALAGTSLFGQTGATMSTPPPSTPPPSANPAPEREPTPVDGLIHVQKLPSTAQLTADAEAEGMVVTRVEESPDRIVVTYRYASGNTRTFAYTTQLPVDPALDVAPAAPAPVRSPAENYTIIYREPAPVIYESYPRYVTRYYDPWPTFSLGLNFGRSYGSYGHYGYRPRYHGYRHHHHHGHHRGGWRH